VHSAEPRTWSKAEIDFALAVADRTYATIARIRAEEHQSVLNQELSHRLKNTLAMVQAITNQTLRNIAERDIVKALEARIIALSKAHDVLIEQKFVSAPIGSVVTQVLGLHGHEGQFESGGPDITMSPKATLSLSLLLHELATNAIKYGALSVDTGRVALNWRIEASDAQPILVLSWLERDGPPARTPTRKGFGSRLIGMGLVGAGSARLDYGEEGLAAEFSAPLRAIVES
jgi:two-component sensor histidine kinase